MYTPQEKKLISNKKMLDLFQYYGGRITREAIHMIAEEISKEFLARHKMDVLVMVESPETIRQIKQDILSRINANYVYEDHNYFPTGAGRD